MVVLVTGLCGSRCYYCPLSAKKRHNDVIYANELKVKRMADLLTEGKAISARGSGLTGGDPMVKPKRTINYIKFLKSEFGSKHHIHLYTVPIFKENWLARLAEAGLDEIRFHLTYASWKSKRSKQLDLIQSALKTEPGMDVGVELPALPGCYDELAALSERLDGLGAGFLNLNELEFSETNWKNLRKRGFDVKDDVSAGVSGSEELAGKLVEHAGKNKFNMTVHYCSSKFKDAVQLRNRLLRRAKNTKKQFDIVTDEGMFIRGIIESKTPSLLYKKLKDQYKIPTDLIEYDKEKHRVQIAAWILEDLATEVKEPCFVIEEYPTADRLEVERRRIN